MPYETARIKDLSLALEAISRINGCRSEYDHIRDLLSEAIDKEKETQTQVKMHKPTQSSPFSTDADPSF